jgi:hypothetical protein
MVPIARKTKFALDWNYLKDATNELAGLTEAHGKNT